MPKRKHVDPVETRVREAFDRLMHAVEKRLVSIIGYTDDRIDRLRWRLDDLEAEMAEVTERLDRLEGVEEVDDGKDVG